MSAPSASFLIVLAVLSVLAAAAAPGAESVEPFLSSGVQPCPALSDGAGRRSCPVSCFRSDPVCGDDGVTYWCGCPDAACAGAGVVKRGVCDGGNGGTAGQAFLLLHIVYLIILGFSVIFGFL